MTNLTELWKKGELPNGYYWIRLSWGGMVIMAYHTSFDGLFELDDHYYDEDEISEVLAPVPSYEEYQQLLSDQLAKIEGEEIVAELEERLKKTQELEFEVRRENEKLKKQLEIAKEAISSALNNLACMDRISETECNEQLAFNVLRKCLEELEND